MRNYLESIYKVDFRRKIRGLRKEAHLVGRLCQPPALLPRRFWKIALQDWSVFMNQTDDFINGLYLGLIFFLLAVGTCSSQSPISSQIRGVDRPEDHLLRGQALFDEERYQEAVGEFAKAVKAKPSWVEANYNLGLAYWTLGQMLEAAESFRKTLKLEPTHLLAQYYLGRISQQRDNLPVAIQYFEQLIAANQAKPVSDEYFQLGKAYLTMEKPDKAIAVLEKANELRLRDERIYALLGRAYLKLGQKAAAEKALARSKELRDYQREATNLLLRCSELLKANQTDQALLIYNQLLNTEDVDDLVSLAINFAQSKMYENASQLLMKAIRRDPNLYEAYYNLGLMNLRMGQMDAAEKNLLKAASLRPYSFDVNSLIGVIYSQQGKSEDSLEFLMRADLLRPNDPKVVTLLALQLIDGRYFEEALRILERTLLVLPNQFDLSLLKIQAYYRLFKYEKSTEAAVALVNRFPTSGRANFEAGFHLVQFGKIREARPYLEKAIQLDPSFSEAYTAMGNLLAKENDDENAVVYFRKSLQLNSGNIESYLGLAKSLLVLKKYSEVVDLMEKADKLDPTHPQPHLHLSQAWQALGEKEKAAQELEAFKTLNAQRMTKRDTEGEREYRRQ
jgi:tetratricopeptide (TPR) repeat protein